MTNGSTVVAHAVELSPPDIEPYREGNTGVPYVFRFRGRASGPSVMISAIVHGNELCGAIVLDRLLRAEVRPKRGTLYLAFCNVAAYRRFDALRPDRSRCVDEDLNRVWDEQSLNGPRRSIELERARVLRPIVDEIDHLLDLHSMQTEAPPLMLCGGTEKGRRLAAALGFPNTVVSDKGHLAGRRMRDYGSFGDEDRPGSALLIECGQHWRRGTVAVAQAATVRFLRHFDIIDGPTAEALLLPSERIAPQPQRFLRVTDVITAETDSFRFTRPINTLEPVARAGTVIATDGGRDIQTPYDACIPIMPALRPVKGQTAVRLARAEPPPSLDTPSEDGT